MRLVRLGDAAAVIASQTSVEQLLEAIAEHARVLIGTRVAIATMSGGPTVVNGLSQAEMEGHPRWRSILASGGHHPPPRGWLAVALAGRDGRQLGLVQMTDKTDDHQFSADDEATLVLLARLASVALERLLDEESLRATRVAAFDAGQHLRSLFEASPLPIVDVDLEGRVRLWSPAAERLFGWTADEVLGRPVPFVPDTHHDQLAAHLQQLAAGHELNLVEECRLRRDGTSVTVSIAAAPTRDHTGAVTGATAVVTDLSERKRLEDELLQSQKMEAVGRLAGGVAHDFNNLLTAILGYCELLMMKLPDAERGRFELEEIRNAAERAATLVDQLLTYSRRRVHQPVVLDLNTAIGSVQSMLHRLLSETIDIRTVLADAPCTVRADPTRIEQILLNLATNAHDAMPQGGMFEIRTELVPAAPAGTDLAAGKYVRLTVSDTGSGMDADTLERSFDPFFTTKDPGKGTGLGLSTVYGIVEQSDGHIRVRSARGEGATFEIHFPHVPDPLSAGPTSSDRPRPHSGKETILLVEDNVAVRELTRRVLRTLGYKVLEAGSGRDALETIAARDGRIDLLVTDVVMPGIGGTELAQRIWKDLPELRVLYMSGYPGDTDLSGGDGAARTAFLQKPFDASELVRTVRQLLR